MIGRAHGFSAFALASALVLAACRRETPERAKPAASSAALASASAVPPPPAPAPPTLAFDRDILKLEMAHGEERSAELFVTGPRAAEARLKLIDVGRVPFDVSVLPAQEGKPPGVRLRLANADVGVHYGRATFETGLEAEREIALNYTVKVTGTLSLSPTNPYVPLHTSGQVTVEVRSKQPGFVLRAARVTEGPFTASFRRAGGGYAVEVRAKMAEIEPGRRGVRGVLRLESNDRTEPEKEIPVLAVGSPPTGAPGARSSGN